MKTHETYAKNLFIRFSNNASNEQENLEVLRLLKDQQSLIWFREIMTQVSFDSPETMINEDLYLENHFKNIECRIADSTIEIEIEKHFTDTLVFSKHLHH